MAKRVVEIMYTARCPYVGLAMQRIRSATFGSDVRYEIRLVPLEEMDAAVRARFKSPTVRIDGRKIGAVDLDEAAAHLVDDARRRSTALEEIRRAFGLMPRRRRGGRSSWLDTSDEENEGARSMPARGSSGPCSDRSSGRGRSRAHA